MITIVDCGIGNMGSLINMFARLDIEAQTADHPSALASATGIVLPGVGQFATAIRELRRRGFAEALAERTLGEGIPLLGVCLGMQMLCRGSEEGGEAGLGWIDADIVRFRFPTGAEERVPNMGWRNVLPAMPSPLFPEQNGPWRFYFAHSYHARCRDPGVVSATTHHGFSVPAAIASGNVHGVQFHPEKSHRHGLRLLEAFVQLCARG